MKSILGMITAPAAQAGEFCMTDSSGMRGCGYATMEQCQATASGKNGSCNRDPYFDTASAVTKTSSRNALAYSPKPAHRHRLHEAVAH